ncbi:MAG: glycosyltransferase [Balneolaceae bacterium]|nr:glycosyltransferase [Balneolaceae bacterium]
MSKKKKILIVSKSFYPKQTPRSFRTTELVKELSKRGHDIKLLTITHENQLGSLEEKFNINIENLGPLLFKRFNISGNMVTLGVKKIINRILLQFFEYPNIELMFRVKEKLKHEDHYDLLISIAHPHTIHWGTASARTKKHRIANTWIADCGDPYMGQQMYSFRKPFYFSFFEKNFCRKADYISIPKEEAKEAYYDEFKNKLKVIPQGFDFDEINIDEDAYKKNPIPTLAYAGAFYKDTRDPRPFVEFLLKQDVDFKFIVFTNQKGLLESYVGRGNGKLVLKDYIDRSELLNKLSRMDFLVNFENNSAVQSPSKLIDYYLTGRPVLSIDPKKIDKKKIIEFLSSNYTKKQIFSDAGKYKIENVVDQFLKLT